MAAQSKTVHKKSRGRPAGTNFGETIPARLDPKTVEALDAYAVRTGISRSAAVRRLLALALIGEAVSAGLTETKEEHVTEPKKTSKKPRVKMLKPRLKTLEPRVKQLKTSRKKKD